MPDWIVQGKDWFLGPEAFIAWVLVGAFVFSPILWCCVKVHERFSRLSRRGEVARVATIGTDQALCRRRGGGRN